jgi:hypothetical protein
MTQPLGLFARARDTCTSGGLRAVGLELNVPDKLAPHHHDVVAVRVEFRAQHLDVEDAPPPEGAQRLAHEDVFNDPLPQG